MPVEVSEVLLEAARPDIYLTNAFRVMELPIDATPRELAKRQQIVDMAANTGLNIPSGSGRAFPLPPQNGNGSASMREALQRLRDPERRLVDEFFWFWPHQLNESATDVALQALAQGNPTGARDIWLSQEREQSEANISVHNLAIYYHLQAIELETKTETTMLIPDDVQRRDDAWQQAFRRWKTLLDYENFWDRLNKRIRDLEDPRLTTGMSRRMRTSLPLCLLLINAQFAVHAAERGDNATVQRLRGLMAGSGFPQEDSDEALRRALGPTREMIKTHCHTANLDSTTSNENSDKIAKQLLAQEKPLLAILDNLFPPGNPTRDSAHDDVAQELLACVVAFVNKTEKYQESLDILKEVLPIAVGQSLRTRIEDNIRIISTNLEFERCWFCQENKGDASAALVVKMHGEVKRIPFYEFGRSGTRVEWMKRTITVPRCASCKKKHDKANTAIGVGFVLGAVAGLASCIAITSSSSNAACGGLLSFIAAIGIGSGIGYWISKAGGGKKIKPLDAQSDFPLIKDLKDKGWGIGEKPPGVQ